MRRTSTRIARVVVFVVLILTALTLNSARVDARDLSKQMLDKLCPGFTIDTSAGTVLCVRYVYSPELKWNEQGTQAVRERAVELVWMADDNELVRSDEF